MRKEDSAIRGSVHMSHNQQNTGDVRGEVKIPAPKLQQGLGRGTHTLVEAMSCSLTSLMSTYALPVPPCSASICETSGVRGTMGGDTNSINPCQIPKAMCPGTEETAQETRGHTLSIQRSYCGYDVTKDRRLVNRSCMLKMSLAPAGCGV